MDNKEPILIDAHPDCIHYKNPFGGNEHDKSN